jgi:hypothetical protein
MRTDNITDEVTDRKTINFGGTIVTVMMKKHNVTCRPFLENKLTNTFPRRYISGQKASLGVKQVCPWIQKRKL